MTQHIHPPLSRRGFGRKIVTLAGVGMIGTTSLGLGTQQLARSDDRRPGSRDGEDSHDQNRKGFFSVGQLPFLF